MEPIENSNIDMARTEISPNAIDLEEFAPGDIVLNELGPHDIVLNELGPHDIALNEMGPQGIALNYEMGPLFIGLNDSGPHEISLNEIDPNEMALIDMAYRKSFPSELSTKDSALFEMSSNVTPDSHECDAVSQTSNDERRRRWVDFFDRERYRQYVLLMRSKQFAALVQLIHSLKRETDPFKPPVELPVPEHIVTVAPVAEEEEVETSQSGKSSNSQATTLSSQSCYTTTKSAGSSYVSVRSIDTKKTNTVALVVLIVSILVIAGIISGVVVHLHMDKGQGDATPPNKELHNYKNWITSKEKQHIFQLVNGKFFPLHNRTFKNIELFKDRGHFSLPSSPFLHNEDQSRFRGNNIVDHHRHFTNKNSVPRGSVTMGKTDPIEPFAQITRSYDDPKGTLTQVTRNWFNLPGQRSPIPADKHTSADIDPHLTQNYSGDSTSRRQVARSRLNTAGSSSPDSTFSMGQSGALSTQSDPTSHSTSLDAKGISVTTFKPLNPRQSQRSLSPDQHTEITDLDSNLYIPATDRAEEFSVLGELPGTSGTSRIPEFTYEPMTLVNDRLISTGTSRLLHLAGPQVTTMIPTSENHFYVDGLSRGTVTQGRSVNLTGQAMPKTTANPETFFRTDNRPALGGTWAAALRTDGPATTKSSGTLIDLDALRRPSNFNTSALPPTSPKLNELLNAMNGSQHKGQNSTSAASATSSGGSVWGTTSQDLDRPFMSGGTRRRRPLTRPFRTTTSGTTTTIRTKDLEQFAAVYGGSSDDAPDGPSFGGTKDAMGLDYDLILKDMPLPEVLPTAIATKVAAAPPALTTPPPPRTQRPPKVKLITQDVVAEIGMSVSQGLKVGCMAQEAWGWTYMALSRYEGDHNLSLEFLGGVEKRDEWPFIPIDSRMSDFTLHRDDEMVHLILETKFAMCEDKGRYLCEVNVNRTFFSRTFNVDVKKKPEKPILSFPDDIFAGQTVWITTTWDAGNPMAGHIVHDIIKGFSDLPFNSKEEMTRSWYKDCAIIVENKYTVVPELNWNGTEIIARIEADKSASNLQKSIIERVRFDRKAMVILDANMCKNKMGEKLAHPYNKLKYVACNMKGPEVEVCPELHHFDPKLKTCILTPVKTSAA